MGMGHGTVAASWPAGSSLPLGETSSVVLSHSCEQDLQARVFL